MIRNRKSKKSLQENLRETIVEVEKLVDEQNMEKVKNNKHIYINNAIKRINDEQSVLQFIFHFNYYLLSFFLSFLSLYFSKKYNAEKITIVEKDTCYLTNLHFILLTDKGIYINKFLIPYEYIFRYGVYENSVCIQVFAKIENNAFVFSNSVMKLFITLDNPERLTGDIKKNMCYHIKYNKINDTVFEYYSLV